MNFKESRAIYLQIADRIGNEILQGRYGEEARIPSVREYAATVEVNANTVMRSYDYLQSEGVIFNKRGIGYFVAAGARARILGMRRGDFLRDTLPAFFREMDTLGIPMDEIARMYTEFSNSKKDQEQI